MVITSLAISAVTNVTAAKQFDFREHPTPKSAKYHVNSSTLPSALLETFEAGTSVTSGGVISTRYESKAPLVVTPNDGTPAYANGFNNVKTVVNVPAGSTPAKIAEIMESHIQLLKSEMAVAMRKAGEVPY